MHKLMLFCFLFLTFKSIAMTIPPNNDTTAEGIKYLALGDSYTIGEGVPVGDRYPVQAAKILRNSGIPVGTPMIVAQTGWTSIDLNNVLESQPITDTFDIVTVCIGVNDQYQGRTVEGYNHGSMASCKKLSLLPVAVQAG